MASHDMNEIEVSSLPQPSTASAVTFLTSLIAGGIAGTSVDVALFPIDTIKVRMQSPLGFVQAGGFRGIYNGLGAAALGSAPGAALFFSTYEYMKPVLVHQPYAELNPSLTHMVAASLGEMAACLVRVPTEVIKAKMQTSQQPVSLSVLDTIVLVFRERYEGSSALVQYTGGLYRGFGMTLFREIPFAMIQFPLYEQFKHEILNWQHSAASPWQAAVCGSASGAIAGAVTTPLDVLKTRTQLGKDKDGVPYRGVADVLKRLLASEGSWALLSGIQPRVLWISIGGFVFFGAYETARSIIAPILLVQ